jgi:hypothetical protein
MNQPPPSRGVNSIGPEALRCVDWKKVATAALQEFLLQRSHDEALAAARHSICRKEDTRKSFVFPIAQFDFPIMTHASIPAAQMRPSCAGILTLSKIRGRREGRVLAAPMVTALNGLRNAR